MKKNYITKVILFALIIFSTTNIFAQHNKPKTKPTGKFNPSLIKTSLGSLSGKNITATVEECKAAIGMPITLIDNKNVSYTISTYQFAYKRWGTVEDETTGKVSQQSTLSSGKFSVTPLPEVWQTNVSEFLHSGEQLFLFEIIAFDKKGRKFFAPDITITVK